MVNIQLLPHPAGVTGGMDKSWGLGSSLWMAFHQAFFW
jgi:hypothetical protein